MISLDVQVKEIPKALRRLDTGLPKGLLDNSLDAMATRLRENALRQIATQGAFGGRAWPERVEDRPRDFRRFTVFSRKFTQVEFERRPLLILTGRLLREVSKVGNPRIVEVAPGLFNVVMRGPKYLFAHQRGAPNRKPPLPQRRVFTLRREDIDFIGEVFKTDFARYIAEALDGGS